ncbi:DUF1275 domain-containing protein [Rhizobium cauense]|uniref:YoaK family protein n=1 Tax=Rhizobium cauense TaxID=1166683 RepID=UPI001C6E9BC2|nr:YoaK family protein [Rhizobium cauense]MBW9117968.1 DUF1275 domain-containing protein [Rhizobium cauense]
MMFALLATALAGFVDAVGYAQLNRLYVSFMSGNSTHLGMVLASGQWGEAVSAGSVIVAFVTGSFMGTLLSDAVDKPLLALISSEMLFCAIAAGMAAIGFGMCSMTVVAAIMGIQNVMHQSIANTDVGKGFITGALFGLGQAAAHAIRDRANLASASVNACSWLSFVGGVVCGAHSVGSLGVALSLGVVCFGFLVMIALVFQTAFDKQS